MLRSVMCILILLLVAALPTKSSFGGEFQVGSRSELSDLMVQLRATQFLQHATFGPTESEVNALASRMRQIGVRRAAEEWIDAQFALPASLHADLAELMVLFDGFSPTQSGIGVSRYRYHAWWHRAVTAPDQLRQRTAWALMQICVVGTSGSNFNNNTAGKTGRGRWLGLSNYYDMLLTNSFGTYRDVLGDVTFHPIMGVWLSHLRNKKADPSRNIFPDENYAREVLQLFSIGLYELNNDGSYKKDSEGELIPTYTNEHIETFARLFTGLTYNQSRTINNGTVNFEEPMMMFEGEHDVAPKQVFGGQTLPGDTPGIADINAGLDNIYAHDNVGPFIVRRLIQRFVRSNPSKGYIRRVVSVFNGNGQGTRGDLKAVIKAILLDREAWDGVRMIRRSNPWRLEVVGQGTERSRLQEPVVVYAGFLRRYASNDNPNGWFMLPSLNYNWTQFPYGSPSVFNFYLPDYQPAGELTTYVGSKNIPNGAVYAPEFQLLDAVIANRAPNRLRSDCFNEGATYTQLNNENGLKRITLTHDFSREKALADDPAALAEYLDKTLCYGTMPNELRAALVTAISTNTNVNDRVQAALAAVVSSPAFMIAE